MSAFSTRETRADDAATTSTACLMTAITSSHSPSMLVNMALVSFGRPDSRTTRMASATALETLPESSEAAGLMLKATSIPPVCRVASPLIFAILRSGCLDTPSLPAETRRSARRGRSAGSVEDAQGLAAGCNDEHLVALVHRGDAHETGAGADLRRGVDRIDAREPVRAGHRDAGRRHRRDRAALQIDGPVALLCLQRQLAVLEVGEQPPACHPAEPTLRMAGARSRRRLRGTHDVVGCGPEIGRGAGRGGDRGVSESAGNAGADDARGDPDHRCLNR